MQDILHSEVEARLLEQFPMGTAVTQARSYRPDYRQYPMLVHLRIPNKGTQRCVVKLGSQEAIEREVRVLRLVSELGLPVPELHCDPIPMSADNSSMAVMSELSGSTLPWCGVSLLAEADRACRLMIEGVARLHALTDRLLETDLAAVLPRKSLSIECSEVRANAGAWMDVPLFRRAVVTVEAWFSDYASPLVFSSGDYNPLNFLCDGDALSGFVDFEFACFENPHIGFAKFIIWSADEYGWGTGCRAGLVERYLYSRNVSRREFVPLLVLRSLTHLLRETSLADPEHEVARRHILNVIEEGLRTMHGHS